MRAKSIQRLRYYQPACRKPLGWPSRLPGGGDAGLKDCATRRPRPIFSEALQGCGVNSGIVACRISIVARRSAAGGAESESNRRL
jgi:hypothetical protein